MEKHGKTLKNMETCLKRAGGSWGELGRAGESWGELGRTGEGWGGGRELRQAQKGEGVWGGGHTCFHVCPPPFFAIRVNGVNGMDSLTPSTQILRESLGKPMHPGSELRILL